MVLHEPTFNNDQVSRDKVDVKARWHSTSKLGSVLGFLDGHSEYVESERYTTVPDPKDKTEMAERRYY